jgi:IS4 transposase
MRTLLDFRGAISTFIYLIETAVHDTKAMILISVEPGNYYLMDKGYVDFKQLFCHFHRRQAIIVTGPKDNMKYEVVEEYPVDKSTRVISDSTLRLTGLKSSKWYTDTLRMVVYEDYATGNVYRFLTNDFTHSYLTIAELYRGHWQVECFFKWIKQHLHIKSFYGTSQNAVYSQIWIAICNYLLLAIAKKKMFHVD